MYTPTVTVLEEAGFKPLWNNNAAWHTNFIWWIWKPMYVKSCNIKIFHFHTKTLHGCVVKWLNAPGYYQLELLKALGMTWLVISIFVDSKHWY